MRAVLRLALLCVFSVYTAHCCSHDDLLREVIQSNLKALKNCSTSHFDDPKYYWRSALHLAVERSELDIIRFIVEEKNIDVNFYFSLIMTPLEYAIEHYQLNVVKLLVQLGANVNTRTYKKPYAIFLAIDSNATDIVTFLLESGADPFVTTTLKNTILHEAVLVKNADMVRQLIRYKELINATNARGLTPIDLTTDRPNYYKDVIKVLVEGGSNVPDQLIWNFWDYDIDNNIRKLLVEKSGKVDVRVTSDGRDCRETLLMMLLLMDKPQYDMIRFVIDQGADVKIVYCGNETALHRAAILGRENVTQAIQMLLDHGADINAINYDGFTPLDGAALKGHKEVVEYLRKLGGVHTQSYFIYQSAKMNDLPEMKRLLKSDKNLLNYRTERGITLLHVAAEEGSVHIIRYLVENQQVDVNQKDNEEKTALSKAVQAGKLESVQVLLKLNADENIKWPDEKLKELDDGLTLLHQAAQANEVDVLKFLIKHYRVDLTSSSGETPAFVAARKGSVESLKFLLENKANPYKRYNGFTLLYEAVQADQFGCVKLLTESNYRLINSTVGRNSLPIDIAISTKVIMALVEAGSDVPDSCILKHFNMGNIDLVEYLMTKSGKVNLRLRNGQTLLMILLGSDSPPYDKIKMLLDNGPDVNIKYFNNITALHAAALNARENYRQVIDLLLDHGAHVNDQDIYGFTPLDYGNEYVAAYLRGFDGISGLNITNSEDISKAKSEAQRYLKIQDNVSNSDVVYIHVDKDFEVGKHFQNQYHVVHQGKQSFGILANKVN